jgi:hypothetical protein
MIGFRKAELTDLEIKTKPASERMVGGPRASDRYVPPAPQGIRAFANG